MEMRQELKWCLRAKLPRTRSRHSFSADHVEAEPFALSSSLSTFR